MSAPQRTNHNDKKQDSGQQDDKSQLPPERKKVNAQELSELLKENKLLEMRMPSGRIYRPGIGIVEPEKGGS